MTTADSPIHQFEMDVHFFDTDCYGIMWHGAYTKWMEMGRVNLLRSLGIQITDPATDSETFLFPVLEQNARYRSPARLGDTLLITTRLELDSYKMIFKTLFENKASGKTLVEGVTTIVVINREWRLCRKIPPHLLEKLLVKAFNFDNG